MNVILIMVDSLNRTYLSPYGADIQTPNFERLARRCATMERHWTGSMPTMPCRREVHAGIHEYLWRGWGPLEPFDVTLAQMSREKGQVAMLLTDCYHYFQEGSGNYHMDFTGWEFFRGHETDNWVTDPIDPPRIYHKMLEEKGEKGAAYMRNTARFRDERDFFGPRLLRRAAEWLDENHTHKNFFLMIDSFDVHEPFHVPPPYDRMYDPDFTGEWSIWNNYGPLDSFDAAVARHIRAQYMGKITMFDKWLGVVLDRIDRYGLWDNTLVMLTSDHGHHLGEHGWVGKNKAPFFTHLTNIPFFLSCPGMKPKPGSRSKMLTSQIDMYPTIAEALGLKIPKDYTVHGYSMLPALRGKVKKIRDIAHTGYFGMPVVVTDGRYALHKMPARPDNAPLCSYGINLEGFHKRSVNPYQKAMTGRFLPYTDAIVYKNPLRQLKSFEKETETGKDAQADLLFDLNVGDDISQDVYKKNPKIVARLTRELIKEFERIRAPAEQFMRLGLDEEG
ncbi:MAG: sulfatase [Planctomycetes bacterium]|nr:sulfatase [Planctomycetota bacterium]